MDRDGFLGLGLSAAGGLGIAFLGWGLLAPSEVRGVSWMTDVGLTMIFISPLLLWFAHTYSGALTIVAGFLAGCLVSAGVYFAVREIVMQPRWGVDPGGSQALGVQGVWTTERSAVRVRADGAAAYTLDEGRFLWTYAPPEERAVCAMSPDGGNGVGLVAHAKPNGACDRVTALDLGTGEELWRSEAALGAVSAGSSVFNVLAADARVAVLPAEAGVRALDLRSGKDRWKAQAPDGCLFAPWGTSLVLSGERLAVTYLCGESEGRVEVLEAATGRSLWSTSWKSARPLEVLDVYGTDPVVVNAKEKGEDDAWRLLVFDGGRQTGEIPFSGPDGTVLPAYDKLSLMPGHGVQVHNGTIYTRVYKSDLKESLVAYDRRGGRLWATSPKAADITAFSFHRNEILLLEGDRGPSNGEGTQPLDLTGLRVLDPATGEERGHTALFAALKHPGVRMSHRPGGLFLAIADGEYSLLAYDRK